MAQTQLDAVAKELEESKNLIGSLEARLQTIRANQKASRLGLTLTRSRSSYDPRIRLQEMQLEIADGRKAIATLQQGIKDAKAELVLAQTDTSRKEKVVVKVPTPGVIWHLSVQPGQFVQQGATLVQVLDCKRRWVDVFVDEKSVRSIQPGTPASIELYGSNSQVLQGQVSIIRSGLGRLAAGEDVAVPITPNMPRMPSCVVLRQTVTLRIFYLVATCLQLTFLFPPTTNQNLSCVAPPLAFRRSIIPTKKSIS